MKKNVFTILAMCAVILMFAQTQKINGDVKFSDTKLENFKIEVEVDSAEEVESTFTVEDFRKILNETADNGEVTFKITCHGEKMQNGIKSHVSYEVKGNTDDKEGFLQSISKVRKAAIKYYKSKK